MFRAGFWSKFMFIVGFGLLGLSGVILFYLHFYITPLKATILLISGSILLLIFAWCNQMFPWYGAPIWIEFKNNGLIYQERKFWRGIYPIFLGKKSKDVPKGRPKFLPIENITFIGRSMEEKRLAINFKPVKKTEYLFMKDTIQTHPEITFDILEWYMKNAPYNQCIEFRDVTLTTCKKETIRGKNTSYP